MGVPNLLGSGKNKVLSPTEIITLKELAKKYPNSRIAIDAFNEIYRSQLAMPKLAKSLTDRQGKPTLYIRTIFYKLLKLKDLGFTPIMVFDSATRPTDSMKSLEVQRRSEAKKSALSKIFQLKELMNNLKVEDEQEQKQEQPISDDEEDIVEEDEFKQPEAPKPQLSDEQKKRIADIESQIASYSKQSFSLDGEMIARVKFICKSLGVTVVDSPPDHEAENICAYMTRNGMADFVMSSDADSLLFGAKVMLRPISKTRASADNKVKPDSYELYEYDEILKRYKLTYRQLIEIATALGTDFAESGSDLGERGSRKVKGVGPGTVLSRVTNPGKKPIQFEDSHQKVIDMYINNKIDKDGIRVIDYKATKESYTDLCMWLVDLGFNKDQTKKRLGV